MTAEQEPPVLLVQRDAGVTTVTLNRPEVHNAFNPPLIAALRDTFRSLAEDGSTRVVVLTGAGASFCAGADLRWLQDAVNFSVEANLSDALVLTEMLDAIASC